MSLSMLDIGNLLANAIADDVEDEGREGRRRREASWR
jgi:hypothetical protein